MTPTDPAAVTAEQLARTRKVFRGLFTLASLLEAVLLVVVLLLADFDDPTHQLLLACSLLVYGTLALGLLALGSWLRLETLRVLVAIEQECYALKRPAERGHPSRAAPRTASDRWRARLVASSHRLIWRRRCSA